MPKRDIEAHPISPTHPPQKLDLPGTTSDPIPGLATPNGRWRDRLRERLAQKVTSRGPDNDLLAYLVRAEERADACIGEIAQTSGSCGPIAVTQAVLGAKFAELATYFLDHADPTTKQGRSDILLARACADTSRLNLDGALKTAHAIANSRPPQKTDPTDAFMTPSTTVEEPDPE